MNDTILFHYSPSPQIGVCNSFISSFKPAKCVRPCSSKNKIAPILPFQPLSPIHISALASQDEQTSPAKYDVVVIGSGLGGLSAAALLSAAYGKTVCVCESHNIPGGAAHSFTRQTSAGKFTLHAGPHLYSGLAKGSISSPTLSSNPMQHVLLAVGANLQCKSYDSWGCFFPEGYYPTKVNLSRPLFQDLITTVSGSNAQQQVANLLQAMKPLCKAATALPPAALRAGDIWGSVRLATRYVTRSFSFDLLPHVPQLSKPFATFLNKYVQDPFALNFIDLLCFLLAGVPATRIPTAEVAFMFGEWMGLTAGSSGSDTVLEHPIGGAGAIVDQLVKAIEKDGYSTVLTNAHVDRILLNSKYSTSNKAVTNPPKVKGVKLRSGKQILVNEAIISNVSGWDFPKLLDKNDEDEHLAIRNETNMKKAVPSTEMCPSFMHLHLAFKLTEEIQNSLPHQLEPNYVSVEDWSKGLTSPGNVVLISVPSVIDDTVAPHGYLSLHAYTPATEPFDIWSDVQRGSSEYIALKEERSQALWRAVERTIPNARNLAAEVRTIGTPLTHQFFLRRSKGTYGPAVDASQNSLSLGLPFPKRSDIAQGLFTVGDATFPGIGVPAVAASAWLAANALVDIDTHTKTLRKIGL